MSRSHVQREANHANASSVIVNLLTDFEFQKYADIVRSYCEIIERRITDTSGFRDEIEWLNNRKYGMTNRLVNVRIADSGVARRERTLGQ